MHKHIRTAAIAAAALGALVVHARPADALLTQKCPATGNASDRRFPASSTVDFWITTNSSKDPIAGTGLSQGAFTNAVAQALNIWNEESGAAIRLRYRGFTTATSKSGAFVILGHNVADNTRGATAVTNFGNNTIELFKFGGRGQPIVWSTSPVGGGADLVAVLVHEIGHGVYNIGDFNSSAECPNVGQVSVMRADGTRTLAPYDLELAQNRYNTRAEFGRFYYSQMTGPTSWQTPVATDSAYLRPLFRPGSIGQRSNDPWFGWIYGFDNGEQTGGAGRADVNRFSLTAGSQDWRLFTAPDGALGRPVAVAYRPPGFVPSELLLAYQKVPAGFNVYQSLKGQICYRLSQNEGITWGSEVCPSGALATAYGLTASYDWYSSSFVIAFTQNDPPGVVYEVGILAVPTSDSAGSPRVSFIGVKSPHGPGIACGGFLGGSNCMLAFQSTNGVGNLSWTKVSINASTRIATAGPVSTSTFTIYDTPSVIHDYSDNTFALAYAVNSSAIYSYKMDAVSGTSWTGTGDIYNVPGTMVSSPVLYPAPTGAYAWFVKYW